MYNSNTTDQNELIHTIESTDSRSAKNKLIALLCALLLTGGVILGFFYLRWRHDSKASANQPVIEQKQQPIAKILVDEAMIKGDSVIIGGTVINTSQQPLNALSVELEFTRRKSNSIEKKVLQIKPEVLQPGEKGNYSAIFLSKEFSSVKVTKLLNNNNAVAFNQEAGAKRPLEKPKPPKVNIIVVKPKSKGGEDFINSPDDPVVIK